MTRRATKFTPEVLLSAPRRSAGLPSPSGDSVLYKVSTYSFEDQTTTTELRLLTVQVAAKDDKLVTEGGFGEYAWLDDERIIVLKGGEGGVTKVLVGEVGDFGKSHYEAGTIDAEASALKIVALGEGNYGFAIGAPTTPGGTLYNAEKAKKPKSTGRLYNEIFVRHWDYWLTPQRNSLWYGKLKIGSGKLKLTDLTNALKGTKLECPSPPFGGGDDYDISAQGTLLFAAKDPDVNQAVHTKMGIYMASIGDFDAAPKSLREIPTSPSDGLASSVVISRNGKFGAFLKMKRDGYEADKNEVFVMAELDTKWPVPVNVFSSKEKWDRSPGSVTFSEDCKLLYMLAEDLGKTKLFVVPCTQSEYRGIPEAIEIQGSITDIKPLKGGKAFLSGNSLVENSAYYLFVYLLKQASGKVEPQMTHVSSTAHSGSLFGLSRNQVDDVWYDGAFSGQQIHALMVRPSDFDPKKKYPLAYLIHGGPQGAWNDSWSTRWNPAIFAEQGYVVVCPNPTGSTGYGTALTDAIQGQWGGTPYQDLVKGFEHLEKEYEYIDTDRAVALGASYGGYMINWIQGHDLGRKFKALVCHDGVFSMQSQMASDELWFPFHDIKGPIWKEPKAWAEWDPARFTGEWETPQLVIHSELDYRLAVSEGLAAFNVLQARGVESQFLTFPDENHWVLKPENSAVWHRVVLDFINPKVGLSKDSGEELEEVNMGIEKLSLRKNGPGQ